MENKKITQKKSAIDLTELAFGIIVLGIVVGIGAYTLTNFRDSRLTSIGTYEVANESVTSVNQIGDPLSVAWFKEITTIINATDGSVITPLTNFTTTTNDFGTATLTYNAALGYNNTDVNVTYQVYNQSDPQWSIPNSASVGIGEYGNWFTILVIVGIAGLVIGLIMMTLANKNSTGGGVSY